MHFVVVHSPVIDKINMAFLYGLYPTYCRDGQTFLDYFKSSTNICILHLWSVLLLDQTNESPFVLQTSSKSCRRQDAVGLFSGVSSTHRFIISCSLNCLLEPWQCPSSVINNCPNCSTWLPKQICSSIAWFVNALSPFTLDARENPPKTALIGGILGHWLIRMLLVVMLLWSIPSSCSPFIAPRTSQATAQIDSKSMTVPFSQIKSSRVELDTKSKHIRKLFPCKSLIFVLPCSIFRSLVLQCHR